MSIGNALSHTNAHILTTKNLGEKKLCELVMTISLKLDAVRHTLTAFRTSPNEPSHHHTGVESPSVGNCNTISTKARVHHTVRMSNYCVIGAGVLLAPTEDQVLEDYTVVYGPAAEQRTWSGKGKVQEADLRRKHAEYLREMLPKFNRLRRGDGS